MNNTLSQKCLDKSLDIGNYLKEYLENNKSFKLRSFYGESFTLSLLFRLGILNDELKTIVVKEYQLKEKADPEFHFEFNNYAFSDYVYRSSDTTIDVLFKPLKFKGTPCTNWTLLRSVVRIKENVDAVKGVEEAKNKVSCFQEKNGLILDDPGVKSFQYHCFSSAMLCEIYESNKDKMILAAFLKSVDFIRNFILENGEALYVGRGQEQSFGLGVLVYILAQYAKYTKDSSVLEDIKRILSFIEKFQYKNGSFPLVFTGLESENPKNIDMMSEEFCGWYPYNNFFDYLPFLGLFLHKAHEVLKDVVVENKVINVKRDYADKSFIKAVRKNYTAIVSSPGGYWTNDLPFPLIYSRNRFLTPMLGGEQFQKSLYQVEALSMPMTITGKSWRKYGRGFLFKKSMIWISAFGIMKRNYDFQDKKIKVTHNVFSWIPSKQYFSFLKDLQQIDKLTWKGASLSVSFSSDRITVDKGYSAMGELKVLITPMNVNITMEVE